MRRSRIDAFLREQEGMENIDRDSIERMQLEKLNRLLERERDRAGFYQDLPARLHSLDELRTLPFTTGEELAAHGGAMLLCSQGEVQRVLSDSTSGTTGEAKRVFYTRSDCENTVRLFAAGLGELIEPGGVAMVCMPFSGPFGLGELICEAIERLDARPLRVGASLSYGELQRIIECERPDTYVGMPVPLLSLLRYCGRGSLRRALVSGDACPDRVVRECEGILGSRLFPHYGSREMALGGAICCAAHEGMHLREDHVIAEIVDADGIPLPEGEWGELVITTVGMEAQPLIRYRTGDRTRILPGVCPCGSLALRLDTVSRLDSGEMSALDGELFSVPALVDYRATRRGKDIAISALHTGPLTAEEIRALCPSAAEVELRPATAEDKPLYPGKRYII